MEYMGYIANLEFDDSIQAFHGTVGGLRDVITFESDTVEGLIQEFQASVDDYLEFCKERGEDPDRTYSGNFVVRMPAELHRRVYESALLTQQSMNGWIVHNLASSLAKSDEERELPDWLEMMPKEEKRKEPA